MSGTSTSSGWVTQERLLQLLTASPQHASMAAGHLADMAKDLSSSPASSSTSPTTTPQIDLLWRIAGFLFRKRWEIRVAAALALEKVASVMDLAGLAQCLFGINSSTTTTSSTSGDEDQNEEGRNGATAPTAEPGTPILPVGLGLLRFASLDMARVLADGEPLVASTGEEYQLDRAREGVTREELERQKAEIVKRLGLLEVPGDAKTRKALARLKEGGKEGGDDQLEGCYGIGEEDLLAQRQQEEEEEEEEEGKEEEEGSSSRQIRRRRRKRKVGDLVLEKGGDGAATGGAAGRGPTSGDATKATPTEQQQQQALPWLAEHLSVRLFDANWETRHGAVLGLTALFKAWRRRGHILHQQQEQQQQQQNGTLPLSPTERWLKQWGEDVACRCLCLLALDRFGDYSLGTTVAPIREVAGQLLGLVVLVGGGEGGREGGGEEEHHAGHFEAVLGHVKALIDLQQLVKEQAGEGGREGDAAAAAAAAAAATAAVAANTSTTRTKKARKSTTSSSTPPSSSSSLPSSSSTLTWEIRHGGFVGLKYLVALPSPQVLPRSLALLQWATKGLDDSVEDVREAAATAGLSLLYALERQGQQRKQGEAPVPVTGADLERVLRPVFQAMLLEGKGEEEEEEDVSRTVPVPPTRAVKGGEKEEAVIPIVNPPSLHPSPLVASAPYLITFFRLASKALRFTDPDSVNLDLTLSLWSADSSSSSNWSFHPDQRSQAKEPPGALPLPPSLPPAQVIDRLFLVGTRTSEPALRVPALELLASVLKYWGEVRARYERAMKPGWGAGAGVNVYEVGLRLDQVKGILPTMAWKVLAALTHGLKNETEKSEVAQASIEKMKDVWEAMVTALGPSAIASLVPAVTKAYLGGHATFFAHSWQECAAIQRVAPALCSLVRRRYVSGQKEEGEGREVMENMALEVLQRRDEISEKAALLLAQFCGQGWRALKKGMEGQEEKVKTVLWDVLVEESKEYSRAKEEGKEMGGAVLLKMRRLMLATAVGLVQGAVDGEEFEVVEVERPGLLVRALMESIKEEEDKERQALAAKWLMRLGVSPFQSKQQSLDRQKEGGGTSFEKAMRNLCVLACMKGESDQYPYGRVGAREALKQFAMRMNDPRFGGGFMYRLWYPLQMSLVHGARAYSDGKYNTDSEEEEVEDRWGDEEGSWRDDRSFTGEDAIRLVMVMTPMAQQHLLSRFVEYVPNLLRRACMDAEGDNENTKLVNLLAARAVSNIFKQLPPADLPSLARQMALILHHYLRKRRAQWEEDRRVRAAFVLLEVAKGLREMSQGIEHVKRVLPFLLPVALATVADDNDEVRLYGAESFRLLVEVAPLLEAGEWAVGEVQQQQQQQQDMGKAVVDVEDDAEKKKRKREKRKKRAEASFVTRQNALLRLLLGNKAGASATHPPTHPPLPPAAAPAAAAESIALPHSLPTYFRGGLVLRPYQWEGVMWLTLLRRAGLHGALCDDMGLGKTLQTLVALAVARCEDDEEEEEEGEGGSSSSSSSLPSLVLCPASLAGHWYFEARRFLSPEAIETVPYAAGLSPKDKTSLIAGLGKRHLVVASYDMLRRDLARGGGREGGRGGGLLTGQAWKYVVFDEVHVLRSGEATVLGKAVKGLRAQHRLALTGTPLQNQVHDLWGVFDVLMPGLLGTKKGFETEYGRPIGKATLKNASADATAEALGRLDRLHAHLLPFLLRREKGKVLRDLPPKTITDLACELVPLQREMYEGHCRTKQAQGVLEGLKILMSNEEEGKEGEEGGMAAGREGVKQQLGGQALRLLHYLRLLCVHPALVLQAGSAAREQLMGEVECSGKMVALQNLLFACGVVKDFQEGAAEEEVEGGGGEEDEVMEEEEVEEEDDEAAAAGQDDENKMEEEDDTAATSTLPSPSASGLQSPAAAVPTAPPAAVRDDLHRCLIFAQHRITLDAIERSILRRAQWNPAYAELEGESSSSSNSSSLSNDKRAPAANKPGTRYLRLDGSVPSGQREALVQRFNRDGSIPIMLLTTRVGGLGLNLTGADVVIFVEHDWNPAVDLQAMDRAHRIGQGRPVNVYRLVTRGTVEEQVMALQRRKQGLADAVVTERNATSFEARGGMGSVLDLVAASVGGGAGGSAAFEGSATSGLGAEGAAGAPSSSAAADVSMPSEEPWGEEQYNAFAVESFLANIVGDGGRK